MYRVKQGVELGRHKLPPFDLIFCLYHPDKDLVIVLGLESTKDSVQDLFPDLLLQKRDIGWTGSVTRASAFRMAPEAVARGLRVAFGDVRDGMIGLRPVEIIETRH
jgi:hypothetical protein